MIDVTDYIIRYEQGQLTEDEALELFQNLVDTGLAWRLQGSYGRTATWLMSEGLIEPPSGGRSDRQPVGGDQ